MSASRPNRSPRARVANARAEGASGAGRSLRLPLWALLALLLFALGSPAIAVEFDNEDCLDCHDDEEVIDPEAFADSVHGELSCVDCHVDATPEHDESDEPLTPPQCSECHAAQVHAFETGIHGQLVAEGDPDAPDCSFCHGSHEIRAHTDPRSRTFALHIPALCSECHRDGERSAIRGHATQTHIARTYSMSVHGRGLLESGLLVSAVCSSCHTAHEELPAKDPRSSVNPAHLEATCAKCHYGIQQQLAGSVHDPRTAHTQKRLPDCRDCHNSHAIRRTDWSDFRFEIVSRCGQCHEKLVESYFDTYHGKAAKLGGTATARCYDCHGSHQMYPSSDPRSTLSESHIVATCGKCHPGSNANFVKYRPHASHHDREAFPELYYSYWFMTLLLLGTIGFFGLHSILWLIRSLVLRFQERAEPGAEQEPPEAATYIRRFEPIDVGLHITVVVSFLALVLTGMALKYPDTQYFAGLTRFLGGPRVTAAIHRVGAAITFTYFAVHLLSVAGKLRRGEISLRGLVREDYSLLPQWRDFREFAGHVRWFFGAGPRPSFGRWTYWEKFDYFAVFWGVAVIGMTGLVLWFPEVATLVVPGWVINVCAAIHSDEALLAAAFIFSVHFFNTHFRPSRFPFDPVIFTGRTTVPVFREDHPREYARLVESGELESRLVEPPPRWLALFAWIFGLTALSIGLGSIVAIVYSIVFA